MFHFISLDMHSIELDATVYEDHLHLPQHIAGYIPECSLTQVDVYASEEVQHTQKVMILTSRVLCD